MILPRFIVSSILLLLLPLTGIFVSGQSILPYLEFPPLTRYVRHQPFSWTAFVIIALVGATFIVPALWRLVTIIRVPRPSVSAVGAFPWWGWCGLATATLSWLSAWTRFPWFEPFQKHTFIPLWLSYIVVANAIAVRLGGRCTMIDRPRLFAGLFVLSAAFWWFFEYLNRFVQNWYYEGAELFTATEYVIFATLSFSTVLPAVLGTRECLMSLPVIRGGFHRFASLSPETIRRFSWPWLAISALGLGFIGNYPDYLFPLLWLSPLVITISFFALFDREGIFERLVEQTLDNIVSWALAALICGFFWEMWNFYSYAKWIYSVPFVHRFQIFEMPILGFLGYLPFGLECAIVINLAAMRICRESTAERSTP